MRRRLFRVAIAVAAVGCGRTTQTGAASGTAPIAKAATGATTASSTRVAAPAPAGSGAAPTVQSFSEKMRANGAGMMQAMAAHDIDKVVSFYARDAVLEAYGMPDSVGRDEIKTHLQAAFAAFPDLQFKPTRIWVRDHTAVVESVATGTLRGDLGPLKATGRALGVSTVNVLSYDDDGLVKEEHRYFDLKTELDQLDPHARPGTFRPAVSAPTGDAEVHASTGAPAEASNTQVVLSMYQAMARGKTDTLQTLLADDLAWHGQASPGPPVGRAELMTFTQVLVHAFPDIAITFGATIAADDYVVVETIATGTQTGATQNMPIASGRKVNLHGIDIVQLRGGKVWQGWAYSNHTELTEQIVGTPTSAH
jgi:steroid delta-isomerase-like uncharacterized protein